MIEVNALNKSYGKHHVLKDVSFSLNRGEVLTILGSSGSGKSTLLRSINFLGQPDSGTIKIGDMEVDTGSVKKKQIKELRKNTAMVFQQFNLFRNLTALENVTIGLTEVGKLPKKEAEQIARSFLEKVHLEDRINYFPSQLSGGQQQRVAIARALALNPKVLLFDEPTSALDSELVDEVLLTIMDIAKEGNTMIIVTHELQFAYEVSDKVIYMDDGAIVETGTVDEVFLHPKKERTAQFLSKFRVRELNQNASCF